MQNIDFKKKIENFEKKGFFDYLQKDYEKTRKEAVSDQNFYSI